MGKLISFHFRESTTQETTEDNIIPAWIFSQRENTNYHLSLHRARKCGFQEQPSKYLFHSIFNHPHTIHFYIEFYAQFLPAEAELFGRLRRLCRGKRETRPVEHVVAGDY